MTARRRRQHARRVRYPDSEFARANNGNGALSSWRAPVRKRDADPERIEPIAQNRVMLLRQNLRRRHQRGLRPGLDGEQHRRDGHHRFPGTDIALQEAIHRRSQLQIALNLVKDPLSAHG